VRHTGNGYDSLDLRGAVERLGMREAADRISSRLLRHARPLDGSTRWKEEEEEEEIRPAEMAQQSQREVVGAVGSGTFSRDGLGPPISSLLTNGCRHPLTFLWLGRFTVRLTD
jgi:hypothetical protein